MKWSEKPPKFGDIIRTKVSFYWHYGIFVNEQRVIQFGLPDDPGKPAEDIKVLSSDVYTFLHGGSLEVGTPEKEEIKKVRSAERRVEIAESKIGEGGYDILHNNCEHFVNECAFGEKSSTFVSSVREALRNKLKKQ